MLSALPPLPAVTLECPAPHPPPGTPDLLSCDQVHVVTFGFFDIFQQRWGEGFLSARQEGLGYREEGRPNRAKPCEKAEFGPGNPNRRAAGGVKCESWGGRRGREM